MNPSVRNVTVFVTACVVGFVAWRYASLAWLSHVVFSGHIEGGSASAVRFWLLEATFNALFFGAAGVVVSVLFRSSKPIYWAALFGAAFAGDALIGAAWPHGAPNIPASLFWLGIVVVLPVVASVAAAAAAQAVGVKVPT